MRAILFAVAVVLGASVGWSQQHTVPGAIPQAGYDPFQLNWGTGRFVYAPTPYETSTGPYQFNAYSGRWNYFPVPAPRSVQEILNESRSAPPPQEVQPVNVANRAGVAAPSAVKVDNATPAGAALPPDVSPPPREMTYTRITKRGDKQNTRASTQPSQAAKLPEGTWDPLNLSPLTGQWYYDVSAGRWIHVLPPG